MDDVVDDTELLLRRVPPGSPWQEPTGRITSASFRLARGEDGLSVYRAALVSPDVVLSEAAGGIPGSILLSATAGEVRRACDGNGRALQLDVVEAGDDMSVGFSAADWQARFGA